MFWRSVKPPKNQKSWHMNANGVLKVDLRILLRSKRVRANVRRILAKLHKQGG